jgi:predicted RNase H-like HicB family nuclease
MNNQYTAVIQSDGAWWIGWLEEIPGVNCQAESRDDLVENLKSALAEMLEMNRDEARKAAGDDFEEILISA